METVTFTMNLADMRKIFEEYGFFNVSKEEIETVMRVVLTQYIRDGFWASEVLVAELRQLRSNPEAYKKDADLE